MSIRITLSDIEKGLIIKALERLHRDLNESNRNTLTNYGQVKACEFTWNQVFDLLRRLQPPKQNDAGQKTP